MAEADLIQIASEALVLIGEEPVDSLDGTDAGQVAAAQLLPAARRRLLGCHPWRFNRNITALNRLAEDPPDAAGYDGAYQLPTGLWRLVVPYVDSRPVRLWDVAQGVLWIDATADNEVALEWHGDVDEAAWTPAFRQAVVAALAADLAIAMRDTPALREQLLKEGEVELRRAKHQNAGERVSQQVPVGRFQALRRS